MPDDNGFLASIVYTAVAEFKMPYQDVVWHVPMSFLMLMTRQKILVESREHPGIQLRTIEYLDSLEKKKKNGKSK